MLNRKWHPGSAAAEGKFLTKHAPTASQMSRALTWCWILEGRSCFDNYLWLWKYGSCHAIAIAKALLPVSSKPVKIASQLLLVCPQCLFLVIVEVSAFYAYYFYAIWLPVRKCAAFKLIFINDNERSDLLFCALPAVNTTPRKREEKTARKWYKWFTKDYIIRLYNQVLLNNIAKADHCIYWKIGN